MKKNLPAKRGHAGFKNYAVNSILLFLFLGALQAQVLAQGTWSKVTAVAPGAAGGGMLLLSDGSVICKSFSGGTDGIGNVYMKLTPDIHGSYANGTWSTIAPMHSTRLYYSSQVLKDGRVYVAGGEYGTGGSSGETYDPVTNVWTANAAIGSFVSDANSGIREDGKVVQALVTGTLKGTKIWDPATNTYAVGPSCIGIHNESTWLKLADGSFLMVDRNTTKSERYIQSSNSWIADANVPVSLYDPFGLETGGAVLLPDGRGFFVGSLGHTAFYTPSGSAAPGTWAAGPDLPNGQGTPDAPIAIMVDGNVLIACSPAATSSNHFPPPTSFYVYNYLTNTYTRINAPDGNLTVNIPVYEANLIDLPDGTVLYGAQNSNQYYVFKPSGAPLAAGKPTLKTIKSVGGGTFRVTGTLFNGISEGSNYGDDWQSNTNYPLLRITNGTNVYYARGFNWNSTGVRRGSLPDTFFIKPPAGLPHGTLQLQVVVNGIASDPKIVNYFNGSFTTDDDADNVTAKNLSNATLLYPNPTKNNATLQFTTSKTQHVSVELFDASGKRVSVLLSSELQAGQNQVNIKTNNLYSGVYTIKIRTNEGVESKTLTVQK